MYENKSTRGEIGILIEHLHIWRERKREGGRERSRERERERGKEGERRRERERREKDLERGGGREKESTHISDISGDIHFLICSWHREVVDSQ